MHAPSPAAAPCRPTARQRTKQASAAAARSAPERAGRQAGGRQASAAAAWCRLQLLAPAAGRQHQLLAWPRYQAQAAVAAELSWYKALPLARSLPPPAARAGWQAAPAPHLPSAPGRCNSSSRPHQCRRQTWLQRSAASSSGARKAVGPPPAVCRRRRWGPGGGALPPCNAMLHAGSRHQAPRRPPGFAAPTAAWAATRLRSSALRSCLPNGLDGLVAGCQRPQSGQRLPLPDRLGAELPGPSERIERSRGAGQAQ